MATLKINDVAHNADGSKTITIDDSTTLESVSVAALNSWADPTEDGPILRKFFAGYWKERSGDFSSSTAVVGKVFEYNPASEIGPWLNVGSV